MKPKQPLIGKTYRLIVELVVGKGIALEIPENDLDLANGLLIDALAIVHRQREALKRKLLQDMPGLVMPKKGLILPMAPFRHPPKNGTKK